MWKQLLFESKFKILCKVIPPSKYVLWNKHWSWVKLEYCYTKKKTNVLKSICINCKGKKTCEAITGTYTYCVTKCKLYYQHVVNTVIIGLYVVKYLLIYD